MTSATNEEKVLCGEQAAVADDGCSSEAWLAQAAMCELLALALRYPGEELTCAVASGEWLAAACEIADALGMALPAGFGAGLPEEGKGGASADGSAGDASGRSEDLLRALRPEATRLFVGAPEPVCSLYEGVWRAKADGVHPLLFVNPHSMDVERFCHACGLGGLENVNEPLDSAAVELELMCHLALRAAGVQFDEEGLASEGELPGGSAAAAFSFFANEHASAWMPQFASCLVAETRHPLYRAAGQLLAAFASV